MTQFITLAGKKQTGKDTSAQMIRGLLVDHAVGDHEVSYGSHGATLSLCMDAKIHVVHFADALKRACYEVFGILLEDMETEEGKQKLTDVVWPDRYEVDTVSYSVEPDGVGVKGIVILPNTTNECMTVREVLQFVGTELFRTQMDPDVWVKSVYRKPWEENDIVIVADCRFPNEAAFAKEHGLLISIERDTGLISDGHASETALDAYKDYHYIVDNNGSFDELRMHLEAILVQRRFIIN